MLTWLSYRHYRVNVKISNHTDPGKAPLKLLNKALIGSVNTTAIGLPHRTPRTLAYTGLAHFSLSPTSLFLVVGCTHR